MRGTFILTLFIFISVYTFAAWLNFEPQTVQQPDGTTLHIYATGDEFYNWLHDDEGFTIIQDPVDGFYYYAILDQGRLIPSEYKVNTIDPSAAGLSPWINISPEEMQAKRDYFYKHQMPDKPAMEGYKSPENTKNEGTLNNLVVYIRFSDQSEFTEDTTFYYNMFNGEGNTMLNYFNTVSYDMISIPSWFYPVPEGTTVISYQDIYPRSYFMPYHPVTNPNGYQSGENGPREHALLKRACEYIEDDVPGSLDLDYNSDGYVDNMVFTVKGATTAWGTLLWPHRWALYLETVFIHGKRVWDYNLQIEQHLNNSGAGVLCHEMFHSLSAPDLYHYNTSPYSSVGPWDLMDQANNPPQSMGAYMKYRYGGWINSIPEITECGTYTLNPLSESANNCFRIASPNSSTQYFVLEYRVKEGVFEGGIPGSGLVVYRIDHTLNGQGNAQGPPDEVYVYRPDGSLTNNGDLGQAHFAADYGRTEINDNTNPNPFLQNGQPGGLNISNVGYAGETITFDVWFEKAPVAAFSSSETLVTPGCAVDFYDESLCEVDSWNWTFDGGNPSSSTEQFPTGIVWDTPGTFSVALTVTNTWGTDTKTESTFIVVDDNATPVVEFFASDSVICTNTILSVSDFSSVCPEGWNWEISPGSYGFVNGTGASSQHIDLVLLEPVSYTISLTATNANGSSTITKENYLTAGGLSELYEDFEGEDPFSRGWTVMNEDEDITWEIYNTEGNGSEQAAGINLFNYTSIFARDQLISPPVNLSNATQATLFFEHAYAQSLNTTYTDSLIVKISTDCGQNWETIAELGEDGSYNFATHEPSGFSFIPESSMDWCNGGMYATCQTIDISAYAGNPDTRIMFESVRLTGNNLFIDNVGIESTVGYTGNMVKQSSSFRLSQNPARDFVDIIMTTGHDYSRVVIYNTQGIPVAEKTLETGTTRQKIDLHGYLPGLYFIGLRSGNDLEVKKLIIR